MESRDSFTGRSLTTNRGSALTIRIFGLHAHPAASKDPETVKHCPAFFSPRKARHGGIYVSTRQVSHFMILKEQLRGRILRLSA